MVSRGIRKKIWVLVYGICSALVFPETYKAYGPTEAEVDRQITYIYSVCEHAGFKDYDGNGKVNCCDRATAFCIRWQSQYGRRVRLVQQQTLWMNHMYVQIEMDWGWWSVDPKWTAHGTHDMKRVWQNKYNPQADDINAYWVRHFTRYIR